MSSSSVGPELMRVKFNQLSYWQIDKRGVSQLRLCAEEEKKDSDLRRRQKQKEKDHPDLRPCEEEKEVRV
ncbi:hypothetical protein K1719_002832 [Acacia pycnantha]|nr:hypothetical protein K1719_002832 [Acacia pycnantha]